MVSHARWFCRWRQVTSERRLRGTLARAEAAAGGNERLLKAAFDVHWSAATVINGFCSYIVGLSFTQAVGALFGNFKGEHQLIWLLLVLATFGLAFRLDLSGHLPRAIKAVLDFPAKARARTPLRACCAKSAAGKGAPSEGLSEGLSQSRAAPRT